MPRALNKTMSYPNHIFSDRKVLWQGLIIILRPAIFIFLFFVSCKTKNQNLNSARIDSIHLKKGEIVQCGPPDKQFGQVIFDVSCSAKVKTDFNLAVALLHSFEYDEAEKVFAKIIDAEPACAMAYWGVAMCNFHPLWAPSTASELEKGKRAIAIARSLQNKSEKESEYVEAIAGYYENTDRTDNHVRCLNFSKAMAIIYQKYPADKEAAIFYALSLDAAADPADKTFADQKKAGGILNTIYPNEPDHPGIIHYIIHTYDYPTLAELALPAARKYASIAPSSAHAQHMPSHIFIRLGLWDEAIHSNLVSTASARCYAENSGIKGHWDEELHGMDYLVYAYLQKADDSLAKQQWDYLKTIQDVYPVDLKEAYAFAAIPARVMLENRNWEGASNLEIHPEHFPWEKFPWEKAIIHYTRVLGSAHSGNLSAASAELNNLKIIHDTLVKQGNSYQANLVDIQLKSGKAWMLLKDRKYSAALGLMKEAADMEDATQKHPVTPGEVVPARELLGDMLMEMGYYARALEAYQADLLLHSHRFNGLYGAGLAAKKSGDTAKARLYFRQLSDQCVLNSKRPELLEARIYLKKE
jgi:hypothetical protein